jgi:hypothetical protein
MVLLELKNHPNLFFMLVQYFFHFEFPVHFLFYNLINAVNYFFFNYFDLFFIIYFKYYLYLKYLK